MAEQVIDTGQWLRDLQAALRALWPDRPKVLLQHVPGSSLPVLTDSERGQLTRVAEAIASARNADEQVSRTTAVIEENAVFDFLNWLAPQNIELHKLIPGGCSEADDGDGALWERWKAERHG